MTASRISELAAIVAERTAEIDAYVAAENLPSPSFDPEFTPGVLLGPKIAASRQAILDATDELHALMLGPVGILVPNVSRPLSFASVR